MSPSSSDPLGKIRFVRPDPGADRRIGDFGLRPDVPLPVEIEGDPESVEAKGLAWESIISAMLKILAYDPDHRDASYYRDFILSVRPEIDSELTQAAVAKTGVKDYGVAAQVFLSLRGLFPRNARHSINLAVVYEGRAAHERQLGHDDSAEEDLERAFQAYRSALATDPGSPDAHFYLASFHLRQQSFDKAHDELKAYVALKPTDAQKVKEALSLIEEIESRNLMDELFRSAYDYIRMGKEEKGIARITKFLEANPGVWNGWFLLGWARRRLRRYDEARQAFRRTLELGERNVDVLNELSICSMELGELVPARAYLEEALAVETENVKVLSNLAVLSLREGRPHDAHVYFQLVLDIDPEDPVARAEIARLK